MKSVSCIGKFKKIVNDMISVKNDFSIIIILNSVGSFIFFKRSFFLCKKLKCF